MAFTDFMWLAIARCFRYIAVHDRVAYLTIKPLQVLLFVESDPPVVTVYRRKAEGGFALEYYAGLDDTIFLPEIAAALPLAELYERVEFAS
jgi:hypothetical protein